METETRGSRDPQRAHLGDRPRGLSSAKNVTTPFILSQVSRSET